MSLEAGEEDYYGGKGLGKFCGKGVNWWSWVFFGFEGRGGEKGLGGEKSERVVRGNEIFDVY